ncbi:MAG: ankyrin repeat domain-containing protein [Acidobacteriaceae bacterium]|nr:ankyrin repeat domain-containing protein [Acidobacteriaceae bacterium]
MPNQFHKLPARPNLEQLRKQAKDLLERYRASREGQSDADAFKLHDAQREVARQYGFESWSKLKHFVDGVNVHELAEAVKSGDVERVRSLLSARPELVDMDLAGNDEHRALHFAVLRRDPAMVRLLLEAGADARKGIYPHRDATSALAIARDRNYDEIVAAIEEEERLRREELSCPNATVSPVQERIHRAIAADENSTAIALLEADRTLIQACDRQGATPLHVAAEEANEEMLRWLLDRRANPKKEDVDGRTALDRAAFAADPRNEMAERFPVMAKLLLARGAPFTMYAAVALGDAGRVRELVGAGPAVLRKVDRHGGLLSLAVNHGQIEMVRLLLELGADPDERVVLEELEEPTLSWGMPLWYAALANHGEIAEVLLDHGADPNANVYASGWPLRNAWNHADGRVKKLLIARGAKVQPYMVAESHDVEEARRLLAADASEELSQELTWSAADHGCPSIVELAVRRLAWARDDPRWHWILIQPIRGARASIADSAGHLASMEVLLRNGVDANVSRFGQRPLHFAAAYGGAIGPEVRARFAAMLVEAGARLDVRDDLLRSTPLGWACRWGRFELAQELLDRGARVDEPDAEEWATPKAWALKRGHGEILKLLER